MTVVHVLGGAGFAGAQASALIDAHPAFELGQITSRADAGRRLRDVAPRYRVEKELTVLDLDGIGRGDMAVVCYPHAEAAAVVSELADRGVRVVDVSADHRLRDATLYPPVYGFEHPRPDLLAEAVYGLPERHRDDIRGAQVVANPGCYPEATILALLPLRDRLTDVVVDAKSGVSGAGRTPSEAVHFSSVTENVSPYKVLRHRHQPEMAQELGTGVAFVPHLMPLDRGLLATCYATLSGPLPTDEELAELYRAYYAEHPFVEVVGAPPGMRAVQHTNMCQVFAMADPAGGRVVAFGVLDNIMKGAAGQAVQNLNLMAGRPETEGLA
jgi:N-acetyl-gamma-glutamyl-phosphate reductase